MSSAAGTGALLRLTRRTEVIATPVGVSAIPLLLMVTAASLAPLYPDAASRAELADGAAASPVFAVLLGPLRDTSTIGAIAVWRVGMFALLILSIIVAATVTRNLRAPEASGRLELLRMGAIGPSAPVAAAAITAAGASVAAGVLTGTAALLIGASSTIAVWVGLQFVCAALAAAGIALVVDQIVTTSRAALATSSALIVAAYLLRGVADSSGTLSWLRWLSPIGWAQQIDPAGAASVLPALPCLALFGGGVAVASVVVRRRDIGAGLISPRPGPSRARWPISGLTVATRTMGPALLPWLSGAFAYCLLLGLVTASLSTIVGDSGNTADLLKELGGVDSGSRVLVTALVNTVIGLVAVAAAAAAVSVAGRLRDDDVSGRTEVFLATAVSARARLLSAIALAGIAAVSMLVLAATGIALGSAVVGGDTPPWTDIAAAAVIQSVPTWAVASVAVALYGSGSHRARWGWAVVIADLLLGPLGPLIGAPRWLRDVVPHAHVPVQVGLAPPLVPLIVLVAVGTALTALGLHLVGNRDALQ